MRWKKVRYFVAAVVVAAFVAQPLVAAEEYWPAPDVDVNLNHYCDLPDLVLVGSHYDQMGPPGWRRWDVIRDGAICLPDLVEIGNNYNAHFQWTYQISEQGWSGPRWENPPGSKTLYYRWGTGEIGPGSPWRNAFQDALFDWNSVESAYPAFQNPAFQFAYNDVAYLITIGTVNIASPQLWGTTDCYLGASGYVGSCSVRGNTYPSLTLNQRRGAANHELGHGCTLGHIGSQVTALLRPGLSDVNREYYYVPQDDDVFLVHQVFP